MRSRTGPSSVGYFPEQFRDLHVQHLASFFRELQDSLAHWAAPPAKRR
jgi:uncharacterized circularly permuted ATP-grasp superfamily protein